MSIDTCSYFHISHWLTPNITMTQYNKWFFFFFQWHRTLSLSGYQGITSVSTVLAEAKAKLWGNGGTRSHRLTELIQGVLEKCHLQYPNSVLFKLKLLIFATSHHYFRALFTLHITPLPVISVVKSCVF